MRVDWIWVSVGKEKLRLSGYSVACTTGVLAARGSLCTYLEINRMKILHCSFSSNLFPNTHLSDPTFIIKMSTCEFSLESACDYTDDGRACGHIFNVGPVHFRPGQLIFEDNGPEGQCQIWLKC